MCKELYQRWKGCDCWGFLKVDTCAGLFKTCFGPGGEKDKTVTTWNDGMCSECWDRLLQEAEELAEANRKAEEEAEKLAVASASSRSYSASSGGTRR
ncbi:hypothetical protein SUNI508_03741 [Seiridium unicorne]|uniref:Uncharacterized protein n=1 Tax=Seiridium unicorne TaxID=138068 RepID=A0ABR2VBG8_9PEZI